MASIDRRVPPAKKTTNCPEMRLRSLPIALTLAFIAACQNAAGQGMTAENAVDLANAHLAEVLPQVPLNRQRIETEELNESWRVSYIAPEGSTGGPIVVEVNKQSEAAVTTSIEQ